MMDIYHGTTIRRWMEIRDEGWLNPAEHGDTHVSFSTCSQVASYFAMTSHSAGTLHAEADEIGLVVLKADTETLIAEGLHLFPYSSPVWGEGACDWEKEIACLEPVPVALLEVYASFGPIAHRKALTPAT